MCASFSAENYALFAAALLFGWNPEAGQGQTSLTLLPDNVDFVNPFWAVVVGGVAMTILNVYESLVNRGTIGKPAPIARAWDHSPRAPKKGRNFSHLVSAPVTFD